MPAPFTPDALEDASAWSKMRWRMCARSRNCSGPSILDDFGLNDSLRWLAESFAERTGIDVRYSSSFTGRLDGTVETQLFRIAQEALTNVARHANATRGA